MNKIILYLTIVLMLSLSTIAAADNFTYITNGGEVTIDPIIITGTHLSCSDVIGASYDVCVGTSSGGSGTYNETDESLNATGAVLGVNRSVIQNRVSSTCAVGTAIRIIDEAGTVTCESIEAANVTGFNETDNSLNITGLILGVNTTIIQNRVTTNCGLDSYLSEIGEDGIGTCQNDEDTQLSQTQVQNFMNTSLFYIFHVAWANVQDKFITAVDNIYIYMNGETATLNETKLIETIHGESLNSTEGDLTYLRLDTTNDPLTGNLDLNNNNINNVYNLNVSNHSYVHNLVSYNGNSINIKPGDDDDDYFSFKTVLDRPTIKREGGKFIYFESSNVNDVGVSFRKDDTYSGTLAYAKDDEIFKMLGKASPIALVSNSAYWNYIMFETYNSQPQISVYNGTVLKINDSLDVVGDVNITNNLALDGYMTSSLNMSTNPIYLDGITLKPLDEKNANIAGPAYGIYMTGPSGENLPHLIIQSGGASQASTLLRSQMIVNEIAGFHNTTDATDCIAYMSEVGEVLKIDCNTTTTGADLLVGDDMQVVGDVWLKNENGEWRFMTRSLLSQDELHNNLLLSRVSLSLSGTDLTIDATNGDDIIVNLNTSEYLTGRLTDNVAIVPGTNTTPIMNLITYQGTSPTLTRTASTPVVDFANVGRFLIGADENIYGGLGGRSSIDEFIRNSYVRWFNQGVLYVSDFFPTVDATNISIGTGTMTILLDTHSGTEPVDLINNGSFYVLNNGSFIQIDSLDDITEYSNGGTISNNKYYNLVCGIIHNDIGSHRMMCIVQSTPSSEYVSLSGAEVDTYDSLNIFPSNAFLKNLYLPIARMVIKKGTDEFEVLSNDERWIDLRGTTSSAGSPASPSITSHSDLSNLDYASAGHTGFASQVDLDLVNSTIKNDSEIIEVIQNNLITFEENNIHNGNETFYGTVTIANIDSTTINSTIELQKLNGDIGIKLDANSKADFDVDINITTGNDVCIESGNCLSNMGAGTVTDVTTTTPITSSGGTTPDIAIPVSTSIADGYLDKDDWTIFNNKADTDTQLSGADVVAFVGNWSLDKPLYQIWTTTKTYIDSIGNWSDDKDDYYTSTEILALNSSWNAIELNGELASYYYAASNPNGYTDDTIANTKAVVGDCGAGEFIQNSTISGVECATPSSDGFTYSDYFNQGLNTTTAVTFTTVDTGNGALELYDILGDLATTSPLTGGVNNIFYGTDGTKATLGITVAKDIVTTAPITGGQDNVLTGADADLTIAMTQSDTSTDGWLSSTDWDTFNDKADSDTTYTTSGILLDLTGTVFSINEGTLTDERICEYEATGTQIECVILKDASGDCAAGSSCFGGHTHSEYLEDIVDDTTPQLGADLDANGHDIEIDAENKICFDGVTCAQYMWRNSTGHIQIVT